MSADPKGEAIHVLVERVHELERIGKAWRSDWEAIAEAAGEKPDIMVTSLRGRIVNMRAERDRLRRINQMGNEWSDAADAECDEKAAQIEKLGESRDALAERVKELEGKLQKAHQLATVASDWNLDEVEIDGEMVGIYDLRDEFKEAPGDGAKT